LNSTGKGLAAAAGLLLAPRALSNPARRVRDFEAHFKVRLDMLANGEYSELYESTGNFVRTRGHSDPVARLRKFFDEGNLSGLSKELLSKGLAPDTDETFEKLKEKNAQGSEERVPKPPEGFKGKLTCLRKVLRDVLFKYRDDASLGPFGWSSRTLKRFYPKEHFGHL
jgi:hypothetical protein